MSYKGFYQITWVLFQPNTGGGTDINVILDQILTVSSLSLEDSKNADIHNHRMKNALFAVLCEIKEKTAMNYRNLEMEDPPDPQLMRLDNMLVAEGVVGMGDQGASRAMTTDNTTISHPDYKTKLAQIRTIYSEEMEKYQQGCEVSSATVCERSDNHLMFAGVYHTCDDIITGTEQTPAHHPEGDREDGEDHQQEV